jgi:integrase
LAHHPETTIQQTVNSFIASITGRYAAPSIAAYGQGLRLFVEHIHANYRVSATATPATAITPEWGKSFLAMLQSTRSIETEHLYSRVLIHYLEYLKQQGIALFPVETFATFLDLTRRPKNHVIPAIPTDYVEQIIQYAQDANPVPASDDLSERRYLGALRDKAFLLTLAYSGLRLSEICGLRRQQFSPSDFTLQSASQISMPLPHNTGIAMLAYLRARARLDEQQHTNNQPLFARHDKRAGIRVLAISRWTGANIVDAWVKQALNPAARAELEAAHQCITPHTFRHHFVITALRNTENNVVMTQMMARHGDRSTTRRYLQKLIVDQSSMQSSST